MVCFRKIVQQSRGIGSFSPADSATVVNAANLYSRALPSWLNGCPPMSATQDRETAFSRLYTHATEQEPARFLADTIAVCYIYPLPLLGPSTGPIAQVGL